MTRLSKSKILCFSQCPRKYYLQNVEKVKVDKVPEALQKGIEVHSAVEYYNKNGKWQSEIIDKYPDIAKNFIEFFKVFGKPIESELKIYNEQLGVVGVIDAVYLDNEKLLVLDYKTGKKHPIKDYRFELAIYTKLYEDWKHITIHYWGINFLDAGVKLIEAVDREEIEKALVKVKETREQIQDCEKTGNWEKCESYLCNWCEYRQSGDCL